MEPKIPFRSMYYYNNHMYTLAGHLTEAITGRKYENLVQERIFAPLHMNSSSFMPQLSGEALEGLATSYARTDEGDLVPIPQEAYR